MPDDRKRPRNGFVSAFRETSETTFEQDVRSKRSTRPAPLGAFGEVMTKLLQYVLVLSISFGLCDRLLSEDRKSPESKWTPTSTISTFNDFSSQLKRRTTPQAPTLRLIAEDSREAKSVARIQPLEYDETLARNDEIDRIVAEGSELLAERRWSDAKKRFEKGLKSYPNDAVLRSLFTIARRRQEIKIRYSDASFVSLTKKVSKSDLLAQFDEIFLDVDLYHIDKPSAVVMFDFGVSGVAEALDESEFYRQTNVAFSDQEKARTIVDAFQASARKRRIESRTDVKSALQELASRLQRQIGIAETTIIAEFLASSICSLDAYSSPLTPTQVDDVFSMIDGRFVGLGVELKSDVPTRIARVIYGSPAYEQGIRVGDEIVSIDGRRAEGLTSVETGSLLQGVEGQKATLILRSPEGKLREVVAVRRPIEVPSVEDVHMLETTDGIGYLKITCFQKTTVGELSLALKELSDFGAKRLVVDLRQNPGGLFQGAIESADLFLSSGKIVQTCGQVERQDFNASSACVCRQPLALLVDANSASAAEIFAGALQENDRGFVVGTQSYGKGAVQAIIRLNETNAPKPIAGLRLTTEKFYSPRGRAYSGVGVLPDFVVDSEPEEFATTRQRTAEIAPPYAEMYDADDVASDPCLMKAIVELNRAKR